LNASRNTLIIGDNGSGKSTLLDALCFALFGKAFRKINKPQLVNSVNGKNCLVEIEFETNGKKYKVIRGIKPNTFEIWCDSILLNQDSSSKDYQEHLERFILRMNYKTFCQIVILGSASFTPFMQLTPADRRSVIEDLLDIEIFSVMNVLVKQKMSENKVNISQTKIEIAGKEEKLDFVKKTIEKLQQNTDDTITKLKTKNASLTKTIDSFKEEYALHEAKIEELLLETQDLPSLKTKHTKLVKIQTQVDVKRSRIQTEQAFFENNESCPTCYQHIDDTIKTQNISSRVIELQKIDSGLADLSKQLDSLAEDMNRIDTILQSISSKKQLVSAIKNKIAVYEGQQKIIEAELNKLLETNTMLEQNIEEKTNIEKSLLELNAKLQDLFKEKVKIENALLLLKDGGIKAKIIKQYLPIINKHINKYLSQMGFFAKFVINEQFEETIKSRYLDEFSYQNFSEGEKNRIDLAILFTWRSIAKMRNSASTNLLIFDEIFDGSLDSNGTDEFLKIMWGLTPDTNVIVISHNKDQMIDKFQKTYLFKKHKNFSRLTT